jgi:hypothetical protein
LHGWSASAATTTSKQLSRRGVGEAFEVYEIPKARTFRS